MNKILTLFLLLFSALGVFGQADYRSFATGNWNVAGSWETFNGTSWVAASASPASTDGTITIQTGHTITVTADLSIDQVVVQSGASLRVDLLRILTILDGTGTDLIVNGTFALLDDGFGLDGSTVNVNSNATVSNAGSITLTSPPSILSFAANSTYQHAQDGATTNPIPLANWNSTSICEITGVTGTVPPQLNQNFGHVVWNCAGQSGNLTLGISSIAGNLTVSNTNSRVVIGTQTNSTTLTVSGNLIISGTSRYVVTTTATGITLNVNGSFQNTSSGTSLIATTGSAVLNVKGNFTHSAGALNSNASSNLNFNGTTAQTYVGGGSYSNVNFTVNSGATLDFQTYAITGAGSFTNNGTIRVGSTELSGAIQAAPATAGNIQGTGTRTYASGSTIIYNGAAAQFVGDGHPTSAGINTTINNASGVTLAANLTITGNLTLTSGNLAVAGLTLTLNGTITPNANFINVSSTSNLVVNGTGALGTLPVTGSATINNFTINRTSTGSVTLGSSLGITGTFTQTDGDLMLNGNTLTLSGVYSRTAGNIGITSASSLIIDGSGTLPAAFSFTGTALNTLTLNRASSTLATGASFSLTTLNLTSGTFNNTSTITMASGGTINRTNSGSMSTAPVAATSYNVVYTIVNPITTGVELPTGTTQLNNLTKDGSAELTLGSGITVGGVLTLTSGTFNSSTFALDLKGNFVSNGTSTLTSSAITFSGTTTISGSAVPTFGAITISGTLTPSISFQINGNLANNGILNAGSGTTTFGGTTTISGTSTSSFNNVTINTGSALTAPTGNFNVAGTWTNNGTFNAGVSTNTVTFNGTSSIAGSSATNFSGITVSGTLTAPATLNVAGNFTNNGIFNRGTGTVVFNGSSVQSIQGSAVTDFNNINVTNTAGPPAVQVQSNANLRGALTLVSNSIFDADGSGNSSIFTLISSGDNPTADAGIATLPTGASVTGNVSVQRYMAIEGTNSRMYRYISSPVQTPALSQIQSEIPVTGTFTGASTCSGCGTSPSMWTYNETVIGDVNTGYEAFAVSANTETLATGRGYSIYVRGNIDPVLSAGSARWDVRAPINSGTVTLPATFTSSGTAANDGWNLVGNPYPSTIDWDAASGWTRTNVNNAIYMRDNATGLVASYVGVVGSNGGSRYIAMGQGFFVQSTASPTFSCTESVKVAGTQTTFFREQTLQDILRITLRQGSIRDESVIRFTETATEEFDGNWDAYKLKNEVFNLSSLTPGDLKLAINSLPTIGCGTTVKLDISDVKQGAYQIDFSEFETFSNDVEMSLHDVYTDTRINPRVVSSYAFEVSSDSASFGNKRFSVSFSYKKPVEVQINVTADVCQGQQGLISIENSENFVSYSLYRNGNLISEPVSGNGASLQIAVDASLLSAGDNEFILQYSPAACHSMVSLKPVTIKSITMPAVAAADADNCGSGSVTLTASGAEEGSYRWYETETGNVAIAGAVAGMYTTPVLTKSNTYYVSAVNALGCEGERKPVMAVIHQYNEVTISIDDAFQNRLISSYETGNQWYINGEAIPGATDKTLEVNQTGLYEVEVKIGECTSRAGREMIILGVGDDPGTGYEFFPNPVKDKLTIELSKTGVSAQGMVYTSSGQPVGMIEFKSAGRKLKGEYIFADQSSGLYLIRILQGNKIIHYKVIKK